MRATEQTGKIAHLSLSPARCLPKGGVSGVQKNRRATSGRVQVRRKGEHDAVTRTPPIPNSQRSRATDGNKAYNLGLLDHAAGQQPVQAV